MAPMAPKVAPLLFTKNITNKQCSDKSEKCTEVVRILHTLVYMKPCLLLGVALDVENHPVALWCQHIVKVVYCKCDCADDANGGTSTETA